MSRHLGQYRKQADLLALTPRFSSLDRCSTAEVGCHQLKAQEPEAQTGVFQRASNLVDAAVSDRTVGSHHVHLLKSINAIANIRKLREAHLKGRYVLDVIDLIPAATTGARRADHRRSNADQRASVPIAPHHRRYVEHRASASGTGYTK
jgi:hypothetical protein